MSKCFSWDRPQFTANSLYKDTFGIGTTVKPVLSGHPPGML